MSTRRCLIFGLGYTARRLAARLVREGWQVTGTRRAPAAPEALLPEGVPGGAVEILRFDDPAVAARVAEAEAILSSVPPDGVPPDGVPPDGDSGLPDPVLRAYGAALRAAPARWIGYLSSTGVYGDTRGAWVDETAPVGGGRRSARVEADLAWQALAREARAPVHIFRLPGIYGPGRSALDRVREGTAHRIHLPGHVFCRIHVDDIAGALLASLARPDAPGSAALYNVADDEPASGAAVTEYACDLLGRPYPPLQTLEAAGLSPMARGFYAESRRVRNDRLRQRLGYHLLYPTYREGLRACLDAEGPER